MKRAYNRGGLSVIALYGLNAVISGAIVGAVAGFLSANLVMHMDLSGNFADILLRNLNELLTSQEYLDASLLGSLIGSVLGMGIGLVLMRAILAKPLTQPANKKLGGGELMLFLLMGFGLWGVGALLGNLPAFFGLEISTGMEDASKEVQRLFLFYAIFGAPLLEELAFRKLLLDSLHPFGKTVAAFTSALLFGLMHGNSAQFMLAFSLGLLLATVYLNTGNIWYTILMHFLINLTGTLPEIFMYFNVDISLYWDVIVGMLVVSGFVVALTYGRRTWVLRLKRPAVPDANRQAFRNPGMLIALIGGLVLIAGFDLLQMVGDLRSGVGMMTLIRLIPTSMAVITAILVTATVGKKTEPAAMEPVPCDGESI